MLHPDNSAFVIRIDVEIVRDFHSKPNTLIGLCGFSSTNSYRFNIVTDRTLCLNGRGWNLWFPST